MRTDVRMAAAASQPSSHRPAGVATTPSQQRARGRPNGIARPTPTARPAGPSHHLPALRAFHRPPASSHGHRLRGRPKGFQSLASLGDTHLHPGADSVRPTAYKLAMRALGDAAYQPPAFEADVLDRDAAAAALEARELRLLAHAVGEHLPIEL